mmetsp:Transcript_7991/g.10211  ORF Transcript_7991/g.10211 Transcript_7991/m.10211 type:complete len:124 (-) Transcript_7991:324-695(-)|eukprot:CAMPEP_0116069192 /NCGR_PEP_ID=MMETSP0322-20121206/12130_1 /TAXON_ID=163516 /ORGANISM="Leptocylindrus danicus var. apora, Strain B651" /LENGTH=123 /DNA_ID=CAMNT_0003556487 /DNA_START=206 /DNA_END=577 /DNA_ORIENTATION=+
MPPSKSFKGCLAASVDSFCSGVVLGCGIDVAGKLLRNRNKLHVQIYRGTSWPVIAGAYFVMTFTSSTMGWARQKDDNVNFLVGFGSTAAFFHYVSENTIRVRNLHGLVGGFIAGSIIYANASF